MGCDLFSLSVSPELSVGQKAPDLTLPDESGRMVKLSSLRGSWVVLTFYAEDDTPVCSKQVCSFRDSFEELEELGVQVYGVSPDSVETHARWRKAEKLPFGLLSDAGNKVATRYGAHGKKIMYGREVEGVIRTTVAIDPAGKIALLQRRIRSAGHGARVAAELRDIIRSASAP